MNGRVFVDTNLFVYLFDSDEPDKQESARSLLGRLAEEATIVVSTQVLQEFYVAVTRKLAEPLPPRQAVDATRELAAYHVVQVDPPMIFAAITLHEKEKTSFWDALILRAAMESGCELLVTRTCSMVGDSVIYGSITLSDSLEMLPSSADGQAVGFSHRTEASEF